MTIPKTAVGGPLLAGILTLSVGFGGMVAWAALAPLHSAVIAPGTLVPETGRKTVKHSDGGTISEILVAEGAQVRAGDVLIRLDRTEAEARLEVLVAQWQDALAQHARLNAELLERPEIEWPAPLAERADTAAVAKAMENQQTLFRVRRAQLETSVDLARERVASLQQEAKTLDEQRTFLADEIRLNARELDMARQLLDKGNTTRIRMMELQREQARLQSRDRELAARIAQIRQQSVEAEAEVVWRKQEYREKVLGELERTRAEVARLTEEMRDAANRLTARDIKAPEDGVVVGLRHLAVGGVITAHEPIFDLVPADQSLLVEARIAPQDIEAVTVGMPSRLTLTAYDARVIGTLDGTVQHVSADRLTDAASHQSYYLAKISLRDATAHAVKSLRIMPGMPVEAKILIAPRTPLDYLVSPITRSYDKAFIDE